MTVQSILRIAFWLLFGLILALSLVPAEDAPTVFADDKLNHILAFFTLSMMARWLWPRINFALLFVFLTAFGGAIELLQLAMGFGRDADWMDFAADIVAIALGMLAGSALANIKSKSSTVE